MKKVLLILFTISMLFAKEPTAQTTSNWDNILYISNKVGWGSESWKHSAEFQSRFNNDFGSMEQWHVEYVASYLASKHIEIVPDFRFTRKSDHTEFRPGIGIIYKNLFEKSQLVHQVKWQLDVENTGYTSHGLRYAIFYNYAFSEKILAYSLAGVLYEIGPDFTDFLGGRVGVGAAYVISKAHSINGGYIYGAINTGTEYTNIGIVSIQLIINIKKEYNYMPAKYISF